MESFIKIVVLIVSTVGLIALMGWLYALGFNYLMDYFEFEIKDIGILQALLMMFLVGFSLFSSNK